MMINRIKGKHFLVFSILLLLVFGVFYVSKVGAFGFNNTKDVVVNKNLPIFTEEYIKNFDGTDDSKPIYIGLDGYVYDVSSGRKFYKAGGPYHNLAGRDSTAQLRIFGGGIIKNKYPVVAALKPSN